MTNRRRFLAGAFLLATGEPAIRRTFAATFPQGPIRLIATHPAGGQADVIGRIVAAGLARVVGQPVVIDNRPGAAGTIGATIVARAPPDGQTLMICSSNNLALSRVVVRDLPYDPLRDFTLLARVAKVPTVLAVGSWLPAKTVAELVAIARAKPGALTGASSGTGSSSGFTLEMLKGAAGIDILQVPYAGLSPAVTALLGHQVDMVFSDFALVAPHARAGTLRLLATPASRRFVAAPELPTLQEAGFGVVMDASVGIAAPAGLPPETLSRLANALAEVVRSPDIRERLTSAGFEPLEDTSEQFAAAVRAEIDRITPIATRLGIAARAAKL